MGLVLEWVFGTIVSTAEKARDGAKRTLGKASPPCSELMAQAPGSLISLLTYELPKAPRGVLQQRPTLTDIVHPVMNTLLPKTGKCTTNEG